MPQIETDQNMLNNIILQKNGMTAGKTSGYSFQTILINGRHLFTTPFTEADGAGEGKRFSNGEGPVGPREAAFTSNLKLIQGKLGLLDSDFPKLLNIFRPPFAHLDSQHTCDRHPAAERPRFAELLRVPQFNRLGSCRGRRTHRNAGAKARDDGRARGGRRQMPSSTIPCPTR